MSNDLIDLMREYGVEVQTLGTDESPDPASKAMFAMLTEIHTLRSRIAAERQPVSDEALDILFLDAYDRAQDDEKRDRDFDMNGLDAGRRAGIRAVRAALGPAAPVIPEGWYIVHAWSCPRATGDYAEVRIAQWRHGMITIDRNGTGSNINDALTAAIEAAKEHDHE